MKKILTSLIATGVLLIVSGCVPSGPSHHRRQDFLPRPPIHRPLPPRRLPPSHIPMPKYAPLHKPGPTRPKPPIGPHMYNSMDTTTEYETLELVNYQPEN